MKPTKAPWTDADWPAISEERISAALTAVGRPPQGPIETFRAWGRSCLQTVPTERGTVWVKHAYRLPPGEERVLEFLSRRSSRSLPTVIATWSGGVAVEEIPGRELAPTDPIEDWVAAAMTLAELGAREVESTEEWLALGVRDRRPAEWPGAVEALLESPVLQALDADIARQFVSFVPDFISRYIDGFRSPATLVHQDSGCCNIHITESGPVIFDWADVVVGHPVFSCDRLLDQTPPSMHEAVIEAFCAPLALSREEFRAMRRSNVLHEVLRYHDELAYLEENDPAFESLANSVRSQIGVLVEFEGRRG